MVDAFAVMLQDQKRWRPARQTGSSLFQVMSRQTDRVWRVWTACRCAKFVINPCHQIKRSNNPRFGIVIDKAGGSALVGRMACQSFHSVSSVRGGRWGKKGDRSLGAKSSPRLDGDKKRSCYNLPHPWNLSDGPVFEPVVAYLLMADWPKG